MFKQDWRASVTYVRVYITFRLSYINFERYILKKQIFLKT